MKKYRFATLFFFSCGLGYAQTNDSFSDGNFTVNPSWTGTLSSFIVNAANQLQLNSGTAGTSFASTAFSASSLDNMEWKFYVKQVFSPSANNYGRVYLASDAEDLTTPLHGYYIQFGEAGSGDAIELFRQDGSSGKAICRAGEGRIATSFLAGLKVTRDAAGMWEILVDYTGGTSYYHEASGVDSTYTSSAFLGIVCVYTASNSSKFYYDDFYAGPADGGTPTPIGEPIQPGEVIVTEIFPDYTPSIGLPESEYVEIYNRSTRPLNLAGLQLSDGNSTASLPANILLPSEYRVITSSSTEALFVSFPNVISVSGFPSLNNDGDIIRLKNPDGVTIDSVRYAISSYKDHDKQEGGWSLELIDPENTCNQEANWTASEDPRGGTPGKENSVFGNRPDLIGPDLLQVFARAPDTLRLVFDEPLKKIPPLPGSFALLPAVSVIQSQFTDTSLRELALVLADTLHRGQRYTITIHDVHDCSGNPLNDGLNQFEFGLPEIADSLDLVVNEVLFNPRPNGVDFVELFNRSGKYISLRGWKLAHSEDGIIKDGHSIATAQDVFMAPEALIAFTPDPTILNVNFPNANEPNFLMMELPALPDDEGSIAIVDDKGHVIDCFFYDKDFHVALLHDDEGVSLERLSADQRTNDPQNWRSASSQSGFGTPGSTNSNSRPDKPVLPGDVTIEPEIFVPDSGILGFARISYSFDQAGFTGNILIADREGHKIKSIATNETLGYEGFFRWDGDREDGSRARAGFYVVWVEIFDASGNVQTFRKRVVVALP